MTSKDRQRQEKLGMSPSTARNKLVQNLLWDFIVETGQNYCFHCGLPMTEEDWSIEHKESWIRSDNPKETYFNKTNIAYSHKSCNYSRGYRHKAPCGSNTKYTKHGCRCQDCKDAHADYKRKYA